MKITTFGNGVRAAVIPLKGMKAVTVEVLVKIGAKYEEKPEAGLSHFLEHMAFKGTIKRPTAMDIFREMDMRGADFEAGTGYEMTSYNITSIAENREWATEMLSDIIFGSLYPEEELIKERGVISEEIKMYHDNPMMGLSSEVVKWLWGNSNIGCWNISGELSDIKGVTGSGLANYRKKMFNTGEMVVVAAGNVEDGDIDLLERYFGNKIMKGQKLPEVKIGWSGERVKVINRKVEQGHVGVMVPTFGSLDRRKYALKLLNVLLAGNSSSRLFEEIRLKKGWAYYVYPIGEEISEGGFWGVQAGVPEKKVEETIKLIKNEITGVGNKLRTEEVARAKAFLKGKLELSMDKSDFWSGFIGNKILLEGKLVSPDEELDKIKVVKCNEVVDLANEIFRKDQIRSLVIMKKK